MTVSAPDAWSAPMGFDEVIRPITNSVFHDSAVPRTQARLIFIHNEHPDQLSTSIGDVDAGGDFQLYALQLEYAFTERFSLVAAKDGYIDFNPSSGSPLEQRDGWANIAAGVKYAFIYNPERQYIMSGIATVEIPTGNGDVWQGRGDGAINLALASTKRWGNFQLSGSFGAQIPFDDAQSLTSFVSLHTSYEIVPWFIPLVELNWFSVLDEGDGSISFGDQPVNDPAEPRFEGDGLINFGSGFADRGDDLVTLGVGFRSRLSECLTSGFAWEFPLTDDEETLIDDRFTFDLIWEF